MKLLINNFIILGIVCFIFMSLNSCFTIGAALFVPGNKGIEPSEKDIGVFEGWHKPEIKNVSIKLTLSNEIELSGKYKGEDILNSGKESYAVVLLETNTKIEKVPEKTIVQTEILQPKKKISKGLAVLFGFGIDVALTAIALSTGEGEGWFEFDTWGPN
jgi:hypothetical protein